MGAGLTRVTFFPVCRIGQGALKTEKSDLTKGNPKLLEGKLDLTKGNLIKTLPQVSEEYKVTFDFICNTTNNNWGNVIHFTTQDLKNSIYGQHIPTVYYNGTRFEIDSSVNGNYIYLQKAAAAPNVWHSVEVSQEKVDGDYVYSVIVDGVSINKVVNTQVSQKW